MGTLAVETKPLHGIKRVPQCNYIGSDSTIRGGGDTTIPSPGRSPKQSLPGIGLHDPLYMVGKLAPNSTHFTRGLVK